MVSAVLDTVVLVRALINPRSICGRLALELYPCYRLVTSPAILKEVLEVLNRPEIRSKSPHFKGMPLHRVLELLAQAKVVQPEAEIGVCRDPEDNKFLEAAVSGNADYLLTEDQDLLVLGRHGQVQIISAESFVRLLEASR